MARKNTAATETTAAETTAVEEKTEEIESTPTAIMEADHNPAKRIYTGATIPGMKQNTVFTGNTPTMLDVPFVRELCMDLKDYGKYVKDRHDPQSRATFCYKKSVELAEKIAAEKN